jgi:hypothetical protein
MKLPLASFWQIGASRPYSLPRPESSWSDSQAQAISKMLPFWDPRNVPQAGALVS